MMDTHKKMSDGEVSDMAFKRLTGDLDKIESDHMFMDEADEFEADPKHPGTKVIAHGVSVHIKPMAGEQTKAEPEIEEDDDADKGPVKLGL